MPTQRRRTSWTLALTLALAALGAATASAQTDPSAPQVDQDAPTGPSLSPEAELNLINLPTTMSLKKHQSYFRLTHRFARDLRRGDFGDLAQDLFSLDNGAVIGLEYRFGILSNLQAGVHRTALSKTIQFFGRYDALRQGENMPVSISGLVSVEGLDNFHNHYQPGIAASVSRAFGSHLVVYGMPTFVAHTQAADTLIGHDHDHDLPTGEADEHAGHDDTFFLGMGARVQILPSVYAAAEVSPRLAGHDPARAAWGFAIEKRTSGHTLQLNFGNSFGTTLGQIARGGSEHDVYMGFNLVRRF